MENADRRGKGGRALPTRMNDDVHELSRPFLDHCRLRPRPPSLFSSVWSVVPLGLGLGSYLVRNETNDNSRR